MITISKSRYTSFTACPKQFWLNFHKPELAEKIDAGLEMRFEQGNEVGKIALTLFDGVIETTVRTPDGSLDIGVMCETTKRLIAENCPAIAEAAFSGGGVYCAVDVLKNNGDGTYDIYEVKSSTSCKPIYLCDVAFQRYALTVCGVKVRRCHVVYINNQYVRNGDIEPSALLVIEDVTGLLAEFEKDIPANLERAQALYKSAEEPPMDINENCHAPYSCAFYGYCSRHLPAKSIFNLYRYGKKFESYRKGIISFEDIRNAKIKLNATQQRQIDFELDNKPPFVDKLKIKEFLNKIKFPIYFLDFETYQTALPPYDGFKPYQQITFQYSLHILNDNAQLTHKEFLADENKNEWRTLAEQLINDIPQDGGSVVVYNASFERTRIKEMATAFPDLAEPLLNINARMIDLLDVFRGGYLYTKEMGGSFSIKSVLPALYPDNPDLDYHANEDVQGGMAATQAFLSLKHRPPVERERIRQNLLKYCGLDTMAMVVVYKGLCEQTG
ncbi:MAG: DUF2779 domain-containing protein [Bacteroidales bacterium]|nr:DUF2779 domain-containing protein [Bacteroidales bacterium]